MIKVEFVKTVHGMSWDRDKLAGSPGPDAIKVNSKLVEMNEEDFSMREAEVIDAIQTMAFGPEGQGMKYAMDFYVAYPQFLGDDVEIQDRRSDG